MKTKSRIEKEIAAQNWQALLTTIPPVGLLFWLAFGLF